MFPVGLKSKKKTSRKEFVTKPGRKRKSKVFNFGQPSKAKGKTADLGSWDGN
jgi:hypothetical protein